MVNQIAKLAEDEQHAADGDGRPTATESPSLTPKKKSVLLLSICIPKVKLQVLEAQEESLEKELHEIKQRMGASSLSRFDLKFKGSPFLELELNKIDIRLLERPSISAKALYIKDIMLTNVEKRGEPKLIFSSSSNDLLANFEGSQQLFDSLRDPFASTSFLHPSADDSMSKPYDSGKTSRMMDGRHGNHQLHKAQISGPEEEDQALYDRYMQEYEDAEEGRASQFLEFFQTRTEMIDRVQAQVGHINVELADSTIRKIYESIIQQMPEAQGSQYRQQLRELDSLHFKAESSTAPKKDLVDKEIDFRCQNVNAVVRDKKDFLLVKVHGMHFKMLKDPGLQQALQQFKIADFQVIQDENDLLVKHYSGIQTSVDEADLWKRSVSRFAQPGHQNPEQRLASPLGIAADAEEEK